MEVVKFAIPLIILSFAFLNIFLEKSTKKKYFIGLFAIIFGFFNGLGSSLDFLKVIEINVSELLPLLTTVISYGASVLVVASAILLMYTLLQKVDKNEKVKWSMYFSIVILCISLPMVLKQVFY